MVQETLRSTIGLHDWVDAQRLWDYHQMGHTLRPCSVAIGLGSHDLGVASFAAQLYLDGFVPTLLFTGANSLTTKSRFPRGEAVHYREHAIELGVPADAILVEPKATNTGQNVTYSRDLLASADIRVESVLLVCKPYAERRSFATFQRLWPEVELICASEPLPFAAYVDSIGNARLVIDMLVGDVQRIIEYPAQGFTIEQEVPGDVLTSYIRLRDSGFDSRLLGH